MAVAMAGQAATLDGVQTAATPKRGVYTSLPGLAFIDDPGNWTGFDVACRRALAAADDTVAPIGLSAEGRFPAPAAERPGVSPR